MATTTALCLVSSFVSCTSSDDSVSLPCIMAVQHIIRL